ncbi:hypothetical protein [Massilia sp. 9I]|uniref:hypothetical protein n=1 Tax=Massilia sp. 9I TaxID=2653152 RepID=UPI0012F1226F|nr:hypothetical protein [Massilia sp. 9I]VXC22282.1 membrane hypothetical protein [Massilia sp. 9I]
MDLFQLAIVVSSLSVTWLIVRLGSAATGSMRILMVLGAWPLVLVAESMLLIARPGAGALLMVLHLACIALAYGIGRTQARMAAGEIAEFLGPLVATGLIGAPLVFLWFADPELRIFGWHHLLQLEALYSALGNGGADLGYFGKALSYPFFGLLPLAAISRMLDLSPTLTYPAFNILSIFVWAGSLHIWLRTVKKDSGQFQNALIIAFLMLSSGALVYLSTLLLQESGLYIYIENRSVPLIAKHRHIDAMTVGLMSLSLQYLCVLLQGRGKEGLRMLETYFGVQACVTYPALGPVAVLFSGMMALRQAVPLLRQRPPAALLACISPVLVALSLLLTMGYLGVDKAGSGLGILLEPKRLVIGVINVGLSIGLLALFAYVAIRKQPRLEWLLTLLALLCLAVLFVLFKLPADIQYKFLYGANILLLFHAASALLPSGPDHAGALRRSWALSALVLGSIVLVIFQLADRRPRMGETPVMDESAFLVRSELGESIDEISKQHGIDKRTVAMVTNVNEPVVPFIRIPQYVYEGPVQVGYSMDPAFIVTSVKGYAAPEHRERQRAIADMLSTCRAMPKTIEQDLNGKGLIFLLTAHNPCLADQYQEHWLPGDNFLYIKAPDRMAGS